MRTRFRSLALFVANLVVVGGALQLAALPTSSPQEREVTAEMIELGEELYNSECEACHGPDGKGDGPAARFLDSQPRDLTAGNWQYAESQSLEAVAKVIAEGIPDTEMEPFDELLEPDEILAVAAYVLAHFTSESDS